MGLGCAGHPFPKAFGSGVQTASPLAPVPGALCVPTPQALQSLLLLLRPQPSMGIVKLFCRVQGPLEAVSRESELHSPQALRIQSPQRQSKTAHEQQ